MVDNIAIGRVVTNASIITGAVPVDDSYPAFCFKVVHSLENMDFTEDKKCNEDERVVCKGTSTRRELKKLPNKTGYKARKEFWR